MTANVLVHLKNVDPEKLAVYRERAGDALSTHGGAAVAGGPAAEALEGAPEGLYVLLRY
ncbi:MAG: DUF1330 domain-containing protein [Pseudomonadota bacterium]